MSLSPYLFDDGLPRVWPPSFWDPDFDLSPDDIFSAAIRPVIPRIDIWPEDSRSSIKVAKDKWSVNVDVQHFAPDEITVKTEDGFIVVEAKHDERQDQHGFVSRRFVRRFELPEEINADAIESHLSSDGVLTIVAPKKSDIQKGEKIIPIRRTGPVNKNRRMRRRNK